MAAATTGPPAWLDRIAADPAWSPEIRAMATSTLGSAGAPGNQSASSRTDVLGEVVRYRHIFGPVAAALAARELWRRYLEGGERGAAAEESLRRAGVTRRSVLRGITGVAMLTGASSLLTACDLVMVPSPITTNVCQVPPASRAWMQFARSSCRWFADRIEITRKRRRPWKSADTTNAASCRGPAQSMNLTRP